MAHAIISTNLILDILCEVDPHLEEQPPAFTKALTAVLRPSLNRVVKACRTPEALSHEIERQRRRVAVYRTTARAYELFLANMANGE